MPKQEPQNIMQAREARAQAQAVEAEAAKIAGEVAGQPAVPTEIEQMTGVQLSIDELFGIIGAQEYELRALRQRVQVFAQQIVTLKAAVKKAEGQTE